jgi:hypothetical protein
MVEGKTMTNEGINIEMPFHTKIRDIKLVYQESYLIEVWTTPENNKNFPQEMEKINRILAADGDQMMRYIKKSDLQKRIQNTQNER